LTNPLTVLFTDIEGCSSRQLGDERYTRLLEDHHRIPRKASSSHGDRGTGRLKDHRRHQSIRTGANPATGTQGIAQIMDQTLRSTAHPAGNSGAVN
jgi:class 3 adenylate cyclase